MERSRCTATELAKGHSSKNGAVLPNPETFITFMIATFMISALFGFVMKFSKLFPHLVNTYYKKLGVSRSMYTDGVSGIIVQATLLFILYLVDLYKKI